VVRIDTDILDVKEYISSGILESYVLNVVSDQERREVECLSKIYPEIRTQLNEIEADMERLAEGWKMPAPADLKEHVMAAIQNVEQIPLDDKPQAKTEAKIVSLNRNASNQWRNIAAAAILAALTTGLLFFSQRSQMTELESNKAQLLTEAQKKRRTSHGDAKRTRAVPTRKRVLIERRNHCCGPHRYRGKSGF